MGASLTYPYPLQATEVYEMSANSEVVQGLIDTLTSTEVRECVEAIRVLGEIKDNRTIGPLLALQKHEHPWIRMSAAKVLGEFHHWAAISGLVDWLKSEHDVMVQSWIVMSLGHQGDSMTVPYLIAALRQTQSNTIRFTILRALGMIGDPQAVSTVEAYLHDADPHVRRDAEEALKKLRGGVGD